MVKLLPGAWGRCQIPKWTFPSSCWEKQAVFSASTGPTSRQALGTFSLMSLHFTTPQVLGSTPSFKRGLRKSKRASKLMEPRRGRSATPFLTISSKTIGLSLKLLSYLGPYISITSQTKWAFTSPHEDCGLFSLFQSHLPKKTPQITSPEHFR